MSPVAFRDQRCALAITARHGRPPFSTYRRMRAAECRAPGSYLRKPRAICVYLSPGHDHAVQMDTRESAVEIIPARGSPRNGLGCGRGHLRENGKAKLISFLGAAHKGRKLGVEARGSLEERRVANALVD